jgi:hypothetical protein
MEGWAGIICPAAICWTLSVKHIHIESDFLFEILTLMFFEQIMLTNTQANHKLHKQIDPRSNPQFIFLFLRKKNDHNASQNIYKLCAIFILLSSVQTFLMTFSI